MTRQEYSNIVAKSLFNHAVRRHQTGTQHTHAIETHNILTIKKLRNEAKTAA